MTSRALFVTRLFEASLAGQRGFEALHADLEDACRMLEAEDAAGRAWCRTNAYPGYTSYASLDDLPRRVTAFGELRKRLDRLAAAFAGELAFDLKGRRLTMDSLWVNILKPGGAHTGHIHPHSVLSGTYYVATPPGASALKLEDPRLPMMMAAPSRMAEAPEDLQTFVYVAPAPGSVLMWESWLRHEVPANGAKRDRISISFNYAWA
ncbi:MAG: TIGR02466 family protein [Pseudomonadota bacterium]